MSEPFLAEVRMVGFNFAPRGWAFCDGQILPISQNQSLYSLLGTTYGGDGRTSFALPDLRGRTPLHVGNGHTLGQRAGNERQTLGANEMPQHTHELQGSSNAASVPVPQDNLAGAATLETYGDVGTAPVAMNAGTIANAGGGQSHETMQPWLAVHFCIALQGLFPSRT